MLIRGGIIVYIVFRLFYFSLSFAVLPLYSDPPSLSVSLGQVELRERGVVGCWCLAGTMRPCSALHTPLASPVCSLRFFSIPTPSQAHVLPQSSGELALPHDVQHRQMCLYATQRPHGGVRWSLPVSLSETRPTTNHMNLPPRTHKHAVWLARACTGIRFDWLTLPPKLQKLNIDQHLKRAKRSDAPTMQFGKAWRHPIQSEWAEALKLQCTPPCGRAVTLATC